MLGQRCGDDLSPCGVEPPVPQQMVECLIDRQVDHALCDQVLVEGPVDEPACGLMEGSRLRRGDPGSNRIQPSQLTGGQRDRGGRTDEPVRPVAQTVDRIVSGGVPCPSPGGVQQRTEGVVRFRSTPGCFEEPVYHLVHQGATGRGEVTVGGDQTQERQEQRHRGHLTSRLVGVQLVHQVFCRTGHRGARGAVVPSLGEGAHVIGVGQRPERRGGHPPRRVSAWTFRPVNPGTVVPLVVPGVRSGGDDRAP